MLEHSRVRLRQQRDVQRAFLLAPLIETDLIGEDGLTRPRGAVDDVHPAREKTAGQDLVQGTNVSRHRIKLHQ